MNISGTITTLESFDRLIEEIRMRRYFTQQHLLPYRQESYRGQSVLDWHVVPSIARGLTSASAVQEAEIRIMAYINDRIDRDNLHHLFYIDPNGRGFENDWSILRQAQHYFIPTRLLDWSLKPEIALYFAVEDARFHGDDGQFLVYYYPEIVPDDIYTTTHYKDVADRGFMNPVFGDRTSAMIGERRRARQHGKFIIQGFDDTLVGLDQQPLAQIMWEGSWTEPCMEKYIIPSRFKPQLKLDLISQGWFKEEIYFTEAPEILNLVQGSRDILTDIINKQ